MASSWFNKAIVYRLTEPQPSLETSGRMGSPAITALAELNKLLAARQAREPGPNELCTHGFAPPIEFNYSLAERLDEPSLEDDLEPPPPELAVSVNNGEFLLLRMRESYRQLPGIVIKTELRRRTDAIERSQMRKVYKKERDQIKDEVVAALLPQAFVLYRNFYALIDVQAGLVWVVAPSRRRAEELLSLLRECLGSLRVRPVAPRTSPSALFTKWVKDCKTNSNFSLLDTALFEDTCQDGGKVAVVRQDLESEPMQLLAAEGKIITKVGVAHPNGCAFVIDDSLAFKRIVWSDEMIDKAVDYAGNAEDPNFAALRIQADCLMLGSAMREVFTELLDHMGGEESAQI